MNDFHEQNRGQSIPEDLVEIPGSESESQRLMARVVKQVENRRSELGIDPVQFPSFEGVPYPGRPENSEYDPDLYHHLKLLNSYYLDVKTEPELQPSPATRIPVIGRIWQLIRDQAHDLVLFYVNRAVTHEVDIDRHMVSVLNSLTVANANQQKLINQLRNELDRMRPGQEP